MSANKAASTFPTVFISYARRDGSVLAQFLEKGLRDRGIDVWLDTSASVAGATWTTEIEQQIDARDLTLAIVTRGAYESPLCRAEQLRTLRKGRRLIPILASPDVDIPLHIEPLEYLDFSDGQMTDDRLGLLLQDIAGNRTAALRNGYRFTRVSYITAPPCVPNYIERREPIRRLRAQLTAESLKAPVALMAVAGMGGIGKTVLAKAITQDEVVQQAFPDGIVWITAGKDTAIDLAVTFREAGKALGDDLSGHYDNELAGRNRYKTILAEKAALVIIDDVWRVNDLEPFLAESPRSRFLFTTRDGSIARFTGAKQYLANVMDDRECRELLAQWAEAPVEELPAEAASIIRECGRLPLAIAVMGALLRAAPFSDWRFWTSRLKSADLTAIEAQLPPGQHGLFRAVGVSVSSLNEVRQRRYRALAVMLDDMACPVPVLEVLWGTDGGEARQIAKYLADRSLGAWDDDEDGLRLHDLQLDYIRALFPDARALEMIQSAVRLSAHVITVSPSQFSSQMLGRLLPHVLNPAVDAFCKHVIENTRGAWLKPARPALTPPGMGLIRTCEMRDVGKMASYLAISADARRAVTASPSANHTLAIWDLESGRVLERLEYPGASIAAVAMSADGRIIALGLLNGKVGIWDLTSEPGQRVLGPEGPPVMSLAMDRAGTRVVAGLVNGVIVVWDVVKQTAIRQIRAHDTCITALASSADGHTCVSASRDHTLQAWNLETAARTWMIDQPGALIFSLTLSVDGRTAVSVSRDGKLSGWDVGSGEAIVHIPDQSPEFGAIAIGRQGTTVLSVNRDNRLSEWDLAAGTLVRTFEGHYFEVTGIAVSSEAPRAISASKDGTVKIWDLNSDAFEGIVDEHLTAVTSLDIRPDRGMAISCSDDCLKIWDFSGSMPNPSTLVADECGPSICSKVVLISGDGGRAVSVRRDAIDIWDLETRRFVRRFPILQGEIFFAAVNDEGTRLTVRTEWYVRDKHGGHTARRLLLYETEGDGIPFPIQQVPPLWRAKDLSFSALSTAYSRTLEPQTESLVSALRRDRKSGSVTVIARSADSRFILVAFHSNTHPSIELWDVVSRQRVLRCAGDFRPNGGISLDGRLAVTFADRVITVVHLPDTNVSASFTCDAEVRCCGFIDGRLLMAGDARGRVYFLKLLAS